MTDITRLINDLNHRMHSAKNLGFDFLFLKLDDLDVIAGALETLQRANTAQGDRIEQLQGTIHQLESRTVTVKMPKLKMLEDYLAEVAVEERKAILLGVRMEFHRALNAEGIKWEVVSG
ncbi:MULTISPECIES: hypothetical protein [Klebsiella]|nr:MULTISPECIES: hypothetical protein [Klebsiella]SVM26854.1 Uncharacterised protein [Klebsiella pneumoniae]SVM33538.1 Uncharacterised protein [Klebsiella pneumoniae]SVM42513.1 Uncharacterised protein [Klebsiella pneumoniae]SVM48836.1 Uncharacterised protein [Klebsiella pneumoniae]SVM57469.1 Uncharacterised protein [Klebsiella pneumoniae]